MLRRKKDYLKGDEKDGVFGNSYFSMVMLKLLRGKQAWLSSFC